MRKVLVLALAVCGLSVDAWAQIADFTPKTPLIGALLHNDAGEARRLLDGGADPNEGRFFGFPPVFLAIQRQDVELVGLLVAKERT